MKHERQTQFGRPMTAVITPDAPMVDKWQALQDVADAADALGLNHRTLGVLRALLTFHHDRFIGPEQLSAVVFPSNKTLSHRLNGMPESTLRRHLAQLVASGVVIRHDSANRKRFKRGAGVPYGFDLSPLAANTAYITDQATQARDTRAMLANLRDMLAKKRQDIIAAQGETVLTDEAKMVLRRKPEHTALQSMITRLDAALQDAASPEMSAPDTQNERHIHSDLSIKTKQDVDKTDPVLGDILDHCKEYKLYFPDRVRHWNDAFSIASRLIGMMGITQTVFADTISRIGKKRSVAAVFTLLDRLPEIENPNAYLTRWAQNAGAGGLGLSTA